MTEDRQWFNVGAVKLPESERDVAASVFAAHPERFSDVLGADTSEDDGRFPVGAHTAYSALLTEREAEQFARASNARYVEPNQYHSNVLSVEPKIPRPRSMRYLQAEQEAYPTLTGTEVWIGDIDEGTTSLSRATKNITLRYKAFFLPNGEPTGEIWSSARAHGCWTSGTAVPVNGNVVDAFTIDDVGGATDASVANAITWCVTKGVGLINMSLTLGASSSIVSDALVAVGSSDVAIFCAAGNDSARLNRFPASTSGYLTYVHSVGSIDMSRNRRSDFSNWGPWVTGMAPGELVYSTGWDGSIVPVSGTSFSTPHVVNLAARIMSAGVSAKQAAAALKATTRDFGLGEEQGGGVYSMQAALRWLNKEPPIVITPGQAPVTPRTRGLPLW